VKGTEETWVQDDDPLTTRVNLVSGRNEEMSVFLT